MQKFRFYSSLLDFINSMICNTHYISVEFIYLPSCPLQPPGVIIIQNQMLMIKMQFPLLGHSPSSPYVTPRGDIVKPSLPPLRKQKLNAIKNYIPPPIFTGRWQSKPSRAQKWQPQYGHS